MDREKTEIQRELVALQNEASDQRQSLLQRQESFEVEAHHQKELAELARQKNQQISQLLADIEVSINSLSVVRANSSKLSGNRQQGKLG